MDGFVDWFFGVIVSAIMFHLPSEFNDGKGSCRSRLAPGVRPASFGAVTDGRWAMADGVRRRVVYVYQVLFLFMF